MSSRIRNAMSGRDAAQAARLGLVAGDLSQSYSNISDAVRDVEDAREAVETARANGQPQASLDALLAIEVAKRAVLATAEEVARIQERAAVRRFPRHFKWLRR